MLNYNSKELTITRQQQLYKSSLTWNKVPQCEQTKIDKIYEVI